MKIIAKNTNLVFQMQQVVQYDTYTERTDKSGYIDAEGAAHLYDYNPGTGGHLTDFIAVSQGQECIYKGKYNSSTFYCVWGYTDQNWSNPTPILACGDYSDGQTFTVPSGVNYIVGWSGLTFPLEVKVPQS